MAWSWDESSESLGREGSELERAGPSPLSGRLLGEERWAGKRQ